MSGRPYRVGFLEGVLAASAAASSASFWSLSFLNRAVFASRACVSVSEIDRAIEIVVCAPPSLEGLNKESLVGIAIPYPVSGLRRVLPPFAAINLRLRALKLHVPVGALPRVDGEPPLTLCVQPTAGSLAVQRALIVSRQCSAATESSTGLALCALELHEGRGSAGPVGARMMGGQYTLSDTPAAAG